MGNPSGLLDRDVFRESVFARDGGKCVICQDAAKDAHHIMERRLFPNGGYYLDNGASLCERHHIEAEQTTLTCEEIRNAAKIERIILPPHLYDDERYDKWGNVFLPNGVQRIKGELYDDESVQKVLPDHVKATFTKYVKYPRTWHLPWSPGRLVKDERVLPSADQFKGRRVVVTAKMDGENTTMYNDFIHARSLTSQSDVTRHWVKNLQAKKGWQIPEGWRVCGENLFESKSIFYSNLTSYFLMFSLWNEKNICLSWDETLEWASILEFEVVPVLYLGEFDEEKIRSLYSDRYGDNEMEGYVVRLAEGFHYRDFRHSVGKYVRADHNKLGHQRKTVVIPNKLKDLG